MSWRARPGALARRVAALTVGLLLILMASDGPTFINPGPLTFQHSQIQDCVGCHAAFDKGPTSWVHAAFAENTIISDSKRCIACHDQGIFATVYANLLKQKMESHKSDCWLVNTGWTGGPYGVGSRMKISHTRAMIRAILDGTLAKAPTYTDPIFNLEVPTECPGVPEEVLNPRDTWDDKDAYDTKATELAGRFKRNFEDFADGMTEEVIAAGPR